MARIISCINLKDSVEKTTTTVAVGEILAEEYNKKALNDYKNLVNEIMKRCDEYEE
ncbi:MAG: hypothetical protein AB6733_05030 [Clostridiaceae bacterium]